MGEVKVPRAAHTWVRCLPSPSQNCGIPFEEFLDILNPFHMGMARMRKASEPGHGKGFEGDVGCRAKEKT